MHTLVLIAMLVGSAHAQIVGDPLDHSGAQQSDSIASAGHSYADQKEYESWVRPYRQFPPHTVDRLDSSGRIIADPTLLGITVLEGDDLPIDEKQARVLGNAYRIVTFSRTVSASGLIWYFQSNFDSLGEDSSDLSKKDLLELMRLLQELPDDHSRLPPPGRRLVIQAAAAGGVVVRVYDRANLPDPVLEIIRIARARFVTWSIHFPPEKAGSPAEFSQAGIQVRWPRATSPDGSLEATQGTFEVVISSPAKGDLRVLREPPPGVGHHVHALFGPFFSPDGRFLLVQRTDPSAIRTYDTRTWQQTETLPGLPPDVVGYFPDKDWKLGVFASSKGDVGLWDSHKRRQIASFASSEELMDATFSPDHSLVAVALRKSEEQHSGLHVGIWRIDGTPVSELEPWNQIEPLGLSNFTKLAGLLAWWSDSEHLLTIVSPDVFYSGNNLALWNAKTGRYGGDLSGCGLGIERFMVSTQDGRVFAECHASGIYMWDASGAINQVSKFEQSLRDAK